MALWPTHSSDRAAPIPAFHGFLSLNIQQQLTQVSAYPIQTWEDTISLAQQNPTPTPSGQLITQNHRRMALRKLQKSGFKQRLGMTGKFKINILNRSKTPNKYVKNIKSLGTTLEFYIYRSFHFLSNAAGQQYLESLFQMMKGKCWNVKWHSQEQTARKWQSWVSKTGSLASESALNSYACLPLQIPSTCKQVWF